MCLSTEATPKRKTKGKEQRKWGDTAITEADMASLDFSMDKPTDGAAPVVDLDALVDEASLGTRTSQGLYEVKDWEVGSRVRETDDVIAQALAGGSDAGKEASAPVQGAMGGLGGLFSRLTGGKSLTDKDLQPVLEAMKQRLMQKNVAKEIADKICEGVGESLVGKKIGSFQSEGHPTLPKLLWLTCQIAINAAVRLALSNSITSILTPKTSTDMLLSIRTKLSSPAPSTQKRMPYSITFVGVNGVGKSTNLSKVCFWLIQNGLRVLIAACDTFRLVAAVVGRHGIPDCPHRSGAVEQLRVHVRNLSMLGVNGAADSKGRVELYEKGYGKDAAGIAKEAIAYGTSGHCGSTVCILIECRRSQGP
jgi:signal recognition particle receptor subunit alpha